MAAMPQAAGSAGVQAYQAIHTPVLLRNVRREVGYYGADEQGDRPDVRPRRTAPLTTPTEGVEHDADQ